jgi:hypothetical protein
MPAYVPSATSLTEPGDTGYSAAQAAAEFRAIKNYMAATLLAGITGLSSSKANAASPVFTGTVAIPDVVVTGAATFSNSPTGPTPIPGDASSKFATTGFVASLVISAVLPGFATYPGRGIVSTGASWVPGYTRAEKLSILNTLGYFQ